MAVIGVNNVSKSFGRLRAVCELSFAVEAGCCFGLLGPNGAGKTTMMKMIYGTAARDANDGGTIEVFGFDPACNELSIKYLSGVVPQENNLGRRTQRHPEPAGLREVLRPCRPCGRERIETLLSFLELSEKVKARIRELSGGMKRRLVIARALLNTPRLLILDEPTTGLDPQVRHLIWEKLRQLRAGGTTILLTTHYMEEAFQICDRVLIMDKGRKVLEDQPQKLLEQNIERYVLEIPQEQAAKAIDGRRLPEAVRVDHAMGISRFYCDDLDRLKVVTDMLDGQAYYLRQANLEDVFLKATGRGLNEKQ
jgi:lipooligosaccharide transport system ATP-binding protein